MIATDGRPNRRDTDDVEVTGPVGISSDPRHIAYTDGEVRQQFTVAFRTLTVLGGELARDSESNELRWVARGDLDGLQIHPSMRLRIDHYFEGREQPYLC